MKKIVSLTALLLLSVASAWAATYYYRGGAITTLSNWQTTRSGGSGSAPANFTSAADIWDFNETNANISGWTVAGSITNTKNGGGAVTTATLTLNANATFTIGGAITTTNLAFTIGSGSTFVFNGNSAQTIPAYSYENLTCSGNNVKSAAGSFSVAGTLNIASGIELSMGSFDLTGANLLTSGTGTITSSSSSATPIPTGRTWSFSVQFTRPGNQTIPAGTFNGSFYCSGSGTKTAGGNLALNSIVVVGSGITLDMGSAYVMSGNPTSINSLGTMKTSVPTATSAAPLPSGVDWGTSGIVEYAAATAQTAMAGTYYNLTNSGGGTKTATGAITVAGTLNLTSGKINTGNNIITLTNANPALHITGASTSNYVYSTGAGRLRRNGLTTGTAHSFPVGTSAYYLPVTIDPDNTSDFAVNVFTGITQDGTPGGTAFTDKTEVVDAVWNVDRLAGSGTADLQLYWNAALEGSVFSTFTTEIGISRYSGWWQPATGDGDNTANSATISIDQFSPFGIGRAGAVLPVKFGALKAYEKSKGIQLEWKSLNEQGVIKYEVERSADARTFTSIGSVSARNAAGETAYNFFDANPLSGNNYFRIRSVNTDGRAGISSLVRINLNKVEGFAIYPNPVRGGIMSFQASNMGKGDYTISVVNTRGQQVFATKLVHNGGAINQTITLPSSLAAGMYKVRVDKGGEVIFANNIMMEK